MKDKLNKLMEEFVKDCQSNGEERYPRQNIEPSFKNFIAWLDDRTWEMNARNN